jgi:hypothetical protein
MQKKNKNKNILDALRCLLIHHSGIYLIHMVSIRLIYYRVGTHKSTNISFNTQRERKKNTLIVHIMYVFIRKEP